MNVKSPVSRSFLLCSMCQTRDCLSRPDSRAVLMQFVTKMVLVVTFGMFGHSASMQWLLIMYNLHVSSARSVGLLFFASIITTNRLIWLISLPVLLVFSEYCLFLVSTPRGCIQCGFPTTKCIGIICVVLCTFTVVFICATPFLFFFLHESSFSSFGFWLVDIICLLIGFGYFLGWVSAWYLWNILTIPSKRDQLSCASLEYLWYVVFFC